MHGLWKITIAEGTQYILHTPSLTWVEYFFRYRWFQNAPDEIKKKEEDQNLKMVK